MNQPITNQQDCDVTRSSTNQKGPCSGESTNQKEDTISPTNQSERRRDIRDGLLLNTRDGNHKPVNRLIRLHHAHWLMRPCEAIRLHRWKLGRVFARWCNLGMILFLQAAQKVWSWWYYGSLSGGESGQGGFCRRGGAGKNMICWTCYSSNRVKCEIWINWMVQDGVC